MIDSESEGIAENTFPKFEMDNKCTESKRKYRRIEFVRKIYDTNELV